MAKVVLMIVSRNFYKKNKKRKVYTRSHVRTSGRLKRDQPKEPLLYPKVCAGEPQTASILDSRGGAKQIGFPLTFSLKFWMHWLSKLNIFGF